jgi:hypothetical protein
MPEPAVAGSIPSSRQMSPRQGWPTPGAQLARHVAAICSCASVPACSVATSRKADAIARMPGIMSLEAMPCSPDVDFARLNVGRLAQALNRRQNAGALPFSRSVREGGASRGSLRDRKARGLCVLFVGGVRPSRPKTDSVPMRASVRDRAFPRPSMLTASSSPTLPQKNAEGWGHPISDS